MFSRLNLLLCAFAFMFLAACAGSKSGGSSSWSDDDGGSGGGGGGNYSSPAKKANELKEAQDEAVKLTEENHKMSREIFDLKNKLNLPQDDN
jgi:hypothetical protein